MRKLLLLRHAKSSWDDPCLDDHERPLNKRGTRDASRVGAWICEQELRPDVVLCSDAVRTRATLAIVLAELGGAAPSVSFEPRLYLAEPPAIIEVLKRAPDEAMRCMVVGHNPGLHALALGLSGGGGKKDLAALAMRMPTAALAVVELEIDSWSALRPGIGRLAAFVTPRDL